MSDWLASRAPRSLQRADRQNGRWNGMGWDGNGMGGRCSIHHLPLYGPRKTGRKEGNEGGTRKGACQRLSVYSRRNRITWGQLRRRRADESEGRRISKYFPEASSQRNQEQKVKAQGPASCILKKLSCRHKKLPEIGPLARSWAFRTS